MTVALDADPSVAFTAGHVVAHQLIDAMSGVLAGRRHQIEVVVGCALAGGHALIEDVPGVGKTLLAQSLAASLDGSFRRVQGTADLLPSDVVGTLTPNDDGFGLHFRPGPVFANIVLFDELNRANARTQSALLEVMEEAHVTVDGTTHPVPDPFLVIATQNPVRMAGTYPLAEGVTDRFMAAVSLGRTSVEEEVEVLTGRKGRPQLEALGAAANLTDLRAAREATRRVHLADPVARYAVGILHATRDHPRVRVGASTRAGVAMTALARALALMDGRTFVAPHDVVRAAEVALPHRLVVAGADTAAHIVAECVAGVAAPRR